MALADWEFRPYPLTPENRVSPSLYMTSPWLCLNALVLDGQKMVVEASDLESREWFESLGMMCIPCPFERVKTVKVTRQPGSVVICNWPLMTATPFSSHVMQICKLWLS
jgi:hypothetical protein